MDKKIVLHGGKKGAVFYGHPWIYKSQIEKASVEKPGAIYPVYSSGGKFLGKGYYNPRSEISVRLLTYKDEDINQKFFEEKIERALQFRKRYIKDTDAYRVVFSESDGLPGLIVDRYAEYAVFQIMTLGMETQKELIVKAIGKVLKPEFLYEKSDMSSRRLEGLGLVAKWHGDEGKGLIEIREGGLKFLVDLERGHKTGFYLDQRDSRGAIKEFVKDKKVLDCFSYTGPFSIYSAFYGAKEVLGIEIQESQAELANRNVRLNGLASDKVKFKAQNAFDALRELDKAKARFDIVILDPPSFARDKKSVEGALAGYKEINLRAMKILNEGGILATFSCSWNIEEEVFLQMVLDAAYDTKKELKILRRCGQALDHPVDPFIPQTAYLKGFIFEVS